MSDYTPPTARSTGDRANFDDLRRRIDGRRAPFFAHHIPASDIQLRHPPKTNQPIFSLFSDDAIIQHTETHTVRQTSYRHESLVNCHQRDDVTELKLLTDTPHERQGNQTLPNLIGLTINSRDIMSHDQVVSHRFRVDMYRSNADGTQHVVDLKVHVQRPVNNHCCQLKDSHGEPNVTPSKRPHNNSTNIASPEQDCFVLTDINVLATMDVIMKLIRQTPAFLTAYAVPTNQCYQMYLYSSHKGLLLFDSDSIVGCHLRDMDELHMRIVPSPPTIVDDRCHHCLIRQYEMAEGGHGAVCNGESYWLSRRRSFCDLLQEPRRQLDAVVDRNNQMDSDTDSVT